MATVLQVVVIGGGYFSHFHHDAWQRLPDTELKAIVEPDDCKRKALQSNHPDVACVANLEQILNDGTIDIVDVVTPPQTHKDLIEKLVSHTSDDTVIICQKPFCRSLLEATQLAHAVNSRKLVVHENFRFQPWYGRIKSMLEQRSLGDVLQARWCFRPGDGSGAQAYLDRQPYFQKMPRFLIHETGIHWIDTFRFLFGEPDSLYADLRRINSYIAGEDAGYFLFQYNSGLRVMFDGNRHLDHAADNKRLTLGEMLIEGSNATLRLDGFGRLWIRNIGEYNERAVDFEFNNHGFAGDAVFRLNQHVVSHILLGTELQNQAKDYLRNLELEELIYRSSDNGCSITC